MNGSTIRKAAIYTARHFFQILGLISFAIFAFLGFQLILFALPCISGEQTITLTVSQIYGFVVVAFGLIFVIFGEYLYRFNRKINKILEEKL